MFATKKISPGGHWIGITRTLCKQLNKSFSETAEAYVLVAIGLFDGFIPLQLEANKRIRLGVAQPYRFAHNHGEQLQFHDGCIAPGRLPTFFLVFCAPVDVFKGLAVGDGTRRMMVPFLQP